MTVIDNVLIMLLLVVPQVIYASIYWYKEGVKDVFKKGVKSCEPYACNGGEDDNV